MVSRLFSTCQLLVFVCLIVCSCCFDSRGLTEGNGFVSPQIARGRFARPGQFPYVATIWGKRVGEKPEYMECGGVLVSEWVVATTATCVAELVYISDDVPAFFAGDDVPVRNASVRVGQTKIMDKKAPSYKVAGMKIYPDYSPDMGAMYQNNLVLLRLSKPVKDVKVPALASPSMTLRPEDRVRIMGFGKLVHTSDNMSNFLRWAVVNKMSEDTCSMAVADLKLNFNFFTIDNSTMCTGTVSRKVALHGDYGYPVVTEGRNPVLLGLMSVPDVARVFSWPPNRAFPFNIHTDMVSLSPWVAESIAEMEEEAKTERRARRAARREQGGR